MSVYQDLKGTTQNSFKIGKQKFNINAAAASALREITLPDAKIDFSGAINGDVLTKTAAGFVMQAPGAATPTKLGTWSAAANYLIDDFVVYGNSIYIALSNNINKQPDINPSDWLKKYGIEFGRIETGAASLTGTIQGSVFVNGNLTLTGNLTINGDLIVLGNIENDHTSGHYLNVKGSIYCTGYIDLYGNANGAGAGYAGGNLTALGNIIGFLGIRVYGGQGSSNGANGGNILSYGDIKTNGVIYTYGGNGIAGSGGNGGTINYSASLGHGVGNVYAWSNIFTYGGTGTTSGGNGGSIEGINIIGNSINANGGNCTASGGAGGSGAAIYAQENIIAKGSTLESIGGTTAGNSSGSNGGNITAKGGSICSYGDIKTYGSNGVGAGSTYTGGNAGSLTAGKDIISIYYGSIRAYGGAASSTATGNAIGGNGGNIYAGGNIISKTYIYTYSGGGWDTGAAGTPGNIYAGSSYKQGNIYSYKKINCSAGMSGPNLVGSGKNAGYIRCCDLIMESESIIAYGGGIQSGGTCVGSGGNGSNITVTGDFIGLTISIYGGRPGDGAQNSGGNGGIFICNGNVYAGQIDAYGAAGANGANADGGTGGTVTIKGDCLLTGGISVKGGNANGAATTTSNGGSGGTITIGGDLIFDESYIEAQSGNASSAGTGYAGTPGTITIKGDVISYGRLYTNAGASYYAGIGINGGNINIGGRCSARQITISGGNAIAGQNNGAPGILTLQNGGNIREIVARDGLGAGNPSAITGRGLEFSGFLAVYTLTFTNRAGIEVAIDLASVKTAVLKLYSFSGTNTLSKGAFGAAQTAALVNPNQNIYSYAAFAWYVHSGVAI